VKHAARWYRAPWTYTALEKLLLRSAAYSIFWCLFNKLPGLTVHKIAACESGIGHALCCCLCRALLDSTHLLAEPAVRLHHTCSCETSVHCCSNTVISVQSLARISAIELCTMAYANAMPACVIGIPAIHILLVVMISAAHRLRSRDQCRYKAKPASSAFVSSSWVPRITYMKTCMPIRLGSQMCIMLIWYTPAVIMI